MNVPSQTEILLLRLKIPVVLDLIEFEIFTWRLLKIAFPDFQISTFSGRANCPKKVLEVRPLALAVFPAVKKHSHQYEHPFSNPSYAPDPDGTVLE